MRITVATADFDREGLQVRFSIIDIDLYDLAATPAQRNALLAGYGISIISRRGRSDFSVPEAGPRHRVMPE